jgi:hypothetical protein
MSLISMFKEDLFDLEQKICANKDFLSLIFIFNLDTFKLVKPLQTFDSVYNWHSLLINEQDLFAWFHVDTTTTTLLLLCPTPPRYLQGKSILNAGGLEPHTKFKNALVLLYKRYFVSEIVLTYCEKILFEQSRNFLKFSAFSLESAKNSRLLEKFIETVKGQSIFWHRILF